MRISMFYSLSYFFVMILVEISILLFLVSEITNLSSWFQRFL